MPFNINTQTITCLLYPFANATQLVTGIYVFHLISKVFYLRFHPVDLTTILCFSHFTYPKYSQIIDKMLPMHVLCSVSKELKRNIAKTFSLCLCFGIRKNFIIKSNRMQCAHIHCSSKSFDEAKCIRFPKDIYPIDLGVGKMTQTK